MRKIERERERGHESYLWGLLSEKRHEWRIIKRPFSGLDTY